MPLRGLGGHGWARLQVCLQHCRGIPPRAQDGICPCLSFLEALASSRPASSCERIGKSSAKPPTTARCGSSALFLAACGASTTQRHQGVGLPPRGPRHGDHHLLPDAEAVWLASSMRSQFSPPAKPRLWGRLTRRVWLFRTAGGVGTQGM